MGPAAEPPSPADTEGDVPLDPTKICWTQWLRAQEEGPEHARPPRERSPRGEFTEEALSRLFPVD